MTIIEWLKEQARPESILLVIHDDRAKRVLAAWPTYRYSSSCADSPVDAYDTKNVNGVLDTVWNDGVDFRRLGVLSDVSNDEIMDVFQRLRHGLLLFPDGTISQYASTLLVAEASRATRPKQ